MILLAALLAVGPNVHGATAMKPVVCRPVEEAKGKTGADLANAIEQMGIQFSRANYVLTAVLPGDPPIACFSSRADSTKLPMGAR
ncbi:MAG TPA: hypothetical protein VLW85_11855 [Myxococcales bacterium]|nr:hypothetical protein [Myxococcales bacterium]